MQPNDNWQVAALTAQDLQKIQQLEPQLKGAASKDIVLIAYQRK